LETAANTLMPPNNVIINGNAAVLYGDNTFTYNVSVSNGLNTFTAIASNSLAAMSTNVSTANVLFTNSGYAYDLNGNLLTDGTRGFTYDDENQLISVWKTNVWRNDFVYDGKMRRRIEKDFNWSGGAWIQTNEVHFIYDGNLVVQERNTNNQPVVEYTRGNDLSGSLQGAGGIGGLLARSQNSLPPTPYYAVHSYYHADGNGNVTMLLNASQTPVAKYLYDPYGNTLAQSGILADANNYRFSSKEWNANSGLYYYLYRFYDTYLQRWLNRDPIQEWGGWNLYEFVGNTSPNFIDFFGTDLGNGHSNDPIMFIPQNPSPPNEAQREMDAFTKCMAQCLGISIANTAAGEAAVKALEALELVGETTAAPLLSAAGIIKDSCELNKCLGDCRSQMKPPPFGQMLIGSPGHITNTYDPVQHNRFW
jgi:RHS repeat-associated protein